MCVEAAWSPLSRVAGALREIAALFLLVWGAVPYSTVYAMGRMEGKVNDTTIEKLIQAAKEVGGSAWPLLVKQQLVCGWTNIAFGVLGTLACVVSARLLLKWVHEKMEDSSNEEVFFALGVGGGLAIAACLMVCVHAMWSSIPQVLFPEGAALASLLTR